VSDRRERRSVRGRVDLRTRLGAVVPTDQIGDAADLCRRQIRKGDRQVAHDRTRPGRRIEGLHDVAAGACAAGEDVELAADHRRRGVVHRPC
jgi:hypothetical protein